MIKYPNKYTLRSYFEYHDGKLWWKICAGANVHKGEMAGGLNNDGNVIVKLNYVRYMARRIVWIMHNGDLPLGVDVVPIDGDDQNISLENLKIVKTSHNRKATRSSDD